VSACLWIQTRSPACDKYFTDPLFIALPLISKAPYALAPCPVATGSEILAHQRLDLIWAEPVRCTDLIEADMIAERHLNDLTDRRGIKIFGVVHIKRAYVDQKMHLETKLGCPYQ